MTDLRARLANALEEHRATWGNDCTCGEEIGSERWQAEHVADTLLSLPGIAIVELPQAEPGRLWTKFGDAMLSNHHPGLIGRPGLLHWIAPAEARKAAVNLLAAANAAEADNED